MCQNLSVADSPCKLAKEMRNVVRDQVQQGKSREEVQAYSSAGTGSMSCWRRRNVGSTCWSGGCRFFAVVAGGGMVYLVARSLDRGGRPGVRPRVDPAYTERVRRELKDRQ